MLAPYPRRASGGSLSLPEERYVKVLSTYVSLLFGKKDNQSTNQNGINRGGPLRFCGRLVRV